MLSFLSITHFMPFLYPLKALDLWFSDVFSIERDQWHDTKMEKTQEKGKQSPHSTMTEKFFQFNTE